MSKTNTKKVLNQAVADLSQASAAVHQIHWYMRGPGFLYLHPKMDEIKDAIDETCDEVAERLITLDGAPYSTLKEFDEHSKIVLLPTSFDVTMQERLTQLVKILKYLVESFKAAIEVAEAESDGATVDLFGAALSETEKTIWMFQAELGLSTGLA